MKHKKIKVKLIDTPLQSGHAGRGIGVYTRLLIDSLEATDQVEVLRSSESAQKNFDLTHYPFFDLFQPTLPFSLLQKTVVTIHDVIPLIFAEHYPVGKRGRLAYRKQRLSLGRTNAVICDSQASNQDIQKYLGIKPRKISTIYLAANPELTTASESEVARVRRQYQLPKHYCLYVGDINYNKNIPQLIKMVKYLPTGVRLVCLGRNFKPQNIPEWKSIEQQMALSNVESQVKFVTEVASDDYQSLGAIYTGAVCYVQPSLYEGFGLPVLEAMQCHTPVVVSQNSSLVEVGGKHALFAQPEAESLANQVKMILGWSEAQRSKHLKAAYAWSQTFSWSKVAAETLAVYQSVL